jgi:DNA-binding LacI/PurR family transcriptional regulator
VTVRPQDTGLPQKNVGESPEIGRGPRCCRTGQCGTGADEGALPKALTCAHLLRHRACGRGVAADCKPGPFGQPDGVGSDPKADRSHCPAAELQGGQGGFVAAQTPVGHARTAVLRRPDCRRVAHQPLFRRDAGSITRAAKRAGFDLLVSFQQLSDDWHKDYEDSHRADGLILLGYGDWETYRERLIQLAAQGTRFARWGSVEATRGLGGLGTTIGSDNVAGGRMAAHHLIGLGRRRIAFVGHSSGRYPEFEARYRGLAEALGAAGLPPPLQADAITTEEAGAAATHALIDSGQSFDAVVAASDLIAIGAMRALSERDLRVPDDIAVTGFDDIPAAASTRPPLTTVVQDTQRAGQLLVDAVRAQLAGVVAPGSMLPTRLVIRRSCGA